MKEPIDKHSPHAAADWFWLCWDIGIITLVAVNLTLILFDSLFSAGPFASLVAWMSQDMHDWYAATVHANFATVDLAFVSVFVLDLLIGWSVAIVQQRYSRWYFYPFIHWYDALGCIPLAGFRWLRVLRIVVLGVRMQRIGLIDVRKWQLYAACKKYYDILVEEISDRVVVNVLSGVQEEMRSGASTLPRRIVQEVVRPRQQQLVAALSHTISATVRTGYQSNRDDIRGYIREIVYQTVERNAAARGIERVPVVGDAIIRFIDDTLTDAVADVLDAAVKGLDQDDFRGLIAHITDAIFDLLEQERAVGAPSDVQDAMIEVIELLKQQVMQQRWKMRYPPTQA